MKKLKSIQKRMLYTLHKLNVGLFQMGIKSKINKTQNNSLLKQISQCRKLLKLLLKIKISKFNKRLNNN
jgi:hypothetical protein